MHKARGRRVFAAVVVLCLSMLILHSLSSCRHYEYASDNEVESGLFAPRSGESINDTLYNAMLNRDSSCDIMEYNISSDTFERDYDLYGIVSENPIIGYLSKYQWHSINGVVEKIYFEYKNVPSNYKERLDTELTKAIVSIKNQLQPEYLDAELVCAINDYIVTHCQYAYEPDGITPDTANGSTVYSVFLQSRAVCAGYAGAFNLLAKHFGLNVVTVSGAVGPNGDSHAWNMVQVDDVWYHVDTTWNDPTPDVTGRAKHDYLLLSDKAISEYRGGSNQYHASWDSDAPKAVDTKYDDAFWIYEDEPISFAELNFEDRTRIMANTTISDIITAAVADDAEANVAKFGYNIEQVDAEIRKLYPYIGYTYTENELGIVIKIGNWKT